MRKAPLSKCSQEARLSWGRKAKSSLLAVSVSNADRCGSGEVFALSLYGAGTVGGSCAYIQALLQADF